MSSSIFHLDANNQLTELKPAEYESEALLQSLLAAHPRLLGAASDTRLLLVRRELGVPGEANGSAQWSLDHLFLDRNGVPVLVEAKRASDTRARREVVAQMLDYAANGVSYWAIEQIVEAWQRATIAAGQDPDAVLLEFLGDEGPDDYWKSVETNLRSGRIRMVFVADRIPKELRRIVEFMNEQMRPAEVLAIEIEQFASEGGLRTLVPRLIGDTERAQAAKAVSEAAQPISDDDWFVLLGREKGEAAAATARKVVAWFRAEGFQVAPTRSQDSMFASMRRTDGKVSYPFFLRRSTAKLETSLDNLKYASAFSSEESRSHLLEAIRRLSPQTIVTTKLNGWPGVPLDKLAEPGIWDAFQRIALDIKHGLGQSTSRSAAQGQKHPLIGSMKGMTTVAEGVDLTAPALAGAPDEDL